MPNASVSPSRPGHDYVQCVHLPVKSHRQSKRLVGPEPGPKPDPSSLTAVGTARPTGEQFVSMADSADGATVACSVSYRRLPLWHTPWSCLRGRAHGSFNRRLSRSPCRADGPRQRATARLLRHLGARPGAATSVYGQLRVISQTPTQIDMTVFQVASGRRRSFRWELPSIAGVRAAADRSVGAGRAVAMGWQSPRHCEGPRHPLLRALGLESLDDGMTMTVGNLDEHQSVFRFQGRPRRHADSSRPACLHACHGGRRSPLCTRRCADSIRTRHRNDWPHVCDRVVHGHRSRGGTPSAEPWPPERTRGQLSLHANTLITGTRE